MNQPSRRKFLTQVSVFALASRSGILGADGGPREPRLIFPVEPRARLAVTSYPFRAYLESPTNHERNRQQPGMDLKDFPGMIAQRFGVHNINPLADHFASTEPAYLDAFRSAVEKAGSHMADLGLAGRKFWDPDAAQRAEAVSYGKRWIDIATVG